MRSDRSANADIIGAGFDRLAGRRESLLIARLRPSRTNPLNHDFDSARKFRAQLFNFMRTGHDSIDSCFDTQSGETQDLIINSVGDPDFTQRFWRRAGQNGHPQEQHILCAGRSRRAHHFAAAAQVNGEHMHTKMTR